MTAALYSADVLADSPDVYLKFNEADVSINKTATDSSGHGANGTYNSGWVAASIASPSGNRGVQCTLASTSSIPFGSNTTCNYAWNQAFSVEFWLYVVDRTNDRVPVCKRAATAGWDVYLQGSSGYLGTLKLIHAVSPSVSAAWRQPTTQFPTGAWEHVVCTNSGSTLAAGLKMYVNSAEVGGYTTLYDTLASDITTTAVPAVGFVTGVGNLRLGDMISDLAIYPSELSPVRIASHYAHASETPAPAFFNRVVLGRRQ